MRDDWDTYFMKMADLVSTRASCDRKHVGAVVVRDKRILTTGYNGSIPSLGHCDDVGHLMENGHCVRTVHAEVSAIVQAAKMGISVKGATMYCNTLPCWNCFKTIVSAGISEIVWQSDYPAQGKETVLEMSGMIKDFTMRKFEPAAKFVGQDLLVGSKIRKVHSVSRGLDGKIFVAFKPESFDSLTGLSLTFESDTELFEAHAGAVEFMNSIARKMADKISAKPKQEKISKSRKKRK